VEVLKGQEKDRDKILSLLAENSKDVSFPGYPYGLVDADKNARVSYEELDALRMLLFSEISKTKGFDTFRDALSGGDAHEWLNRIV
jgi:NurA-like 5'-3' nuclease